MEITGFANLLLLSHIIAQQMYKMVRLQCQQVRRFGKISIFRVFAHKNRKLLAPDSPICVRIFYIDIPIQFPAKLDLSRKRTLLFQRRLANTLINFFPKYLTVAESITINYLKFKSESTRLYSSLLYISNEVIICGKPKNSLALYCNFPRSIHHPQYL